ADCGIVGTERLFVDGERAFVKWLGLCVTALGPIQQCQPVEALSHFAMVLAERLFEFAERALVERLGLCVPALLAIEVTENGERIGVFSALLPEADPAQLDQALC